MAVSFYLATLGCKVNQYESHALREAWSARGWQEAERPEQAGVILVNSCAVTARAVADVRNAVRRLHRAAPQSAIIITGCAAEVLEKELADLPGVRAVIGQSRKEELLADFRERVLAPGGFRPAEAHAGVSPAGPAAETGKKRGASPFPAFAVSGYDRSRAVLKVQDGCSHGCTYCIVPLARGGARSRTAEDSLSEARRLLAAGFREIVISGVNLRQYGRDLPGASGRKGGKGNDFWDLIARLDRELGPEWAGRARLRVSSLEPGQLGPKALDVLGASRMAAPHLHLSLQSGSPSVLRRMGRGHYDPAALPEFFARLRAVWPVFGLGADLLTGFPGESEAEFREGLELCQALPLTYAHVFPYSRRPGTAAAVMDGQLPPALKKERAAALRAMVREKKRAFLQSLLNRPLMRVVFEDRSEPADNGAAGSDPGDTAADGKGAAREAAAPAFWRGVNEFYADCRLDAANAADASINRPLPRILTPVRPVRVEADVLVVGPAENNQLFSQKSAGKGQPL